MTSEEFLNLLRQLREVYLGSYRGLEAKYALSYYLNTPFRPNSRHAIVRRLQRTDWRPHLTATVDAIEAGETVCLLGEDLNVDPLTGLTIDPLAVADIPAFTKSLTELPNASRRRVALAGVTFDVVRLGAGALAVSDTSVDRSAYHSSDFVKWHERVKLALRRTQQ